MANNSNIKKIEKEIKKIEDKKNKFIFFVFDTKGTPNDSLEYIYETAYTLKELGYNVEMFHNEADFVGVEGWLGEKYANLPHLHVNKDNAQVSPSDVLIIPEICTNVMSIKSLPCKRVMLLQNYGYLIDTIPMGVGLRDLKIKDCIATTEILAEKISGIFSQIQAKVVHPAISDCFFEKSDKPKQLVINVAVNNQYDLNSIMKPYYWKNPIYSFVGFREIKNLSREDLAKALREGIATIWADSYTDFGITALEAMACKNIVIGKVPENRIEWMEKDNQTGTFRDNGVWYYSFDDSQDLIASVVQSFITDSIPETIYDEMEDTVKHYTKENQKKEIEKVYGELLSERIKELQIALSVAKNNEEKTEE